ncbi:MAG: GNAT family N-acetyltransferase [Nitrosopumilus sp.]
MIRSKRYKCLGTNLYKLEDYSIVSIQKSDMEPIRRWRNEQISVLRQNSLLTEKEQEEYYRNVIKPSFTQEKPSQILFTYLLSGQVIGYGGLTNIDWVSKKAEVSFLLGTNRTKDRKLYRKEFSLFLDLIKQVAFQDMDFHLLFTETYDIRPLHIEILEENKFKLEDRFKKHVVVNEKYFDLLIHVLINSN